MPVNRPLKEQTRQREIECWRLRCRGWDQHRIAAELKISQGAVSQILKRVDRRELKRLGASVERVKVEIDGQLRHAIEELVDAWHASKLPIEKARRTEKEGGGGDGGDESVNQIETVNREGNAGYFGAAMNAMDRRIKLWGLGVQDAVQEGLFSASEIAEGMKARAKQYDDRTAEDQPAGPAVAPDSDAGGTGEVQDGPGPV